MVIPLGVLHCVNAGEAAKPQLNHAERTGTLPKVIDESSGVIRSRRHLDKDIFWTHNDSGDSARIFAIDSTGKLLREVAIPHARNRDWEEISMDDAGRIIICDIGDNGRSHARFTLYRIAEPDALDPNEVSPEPTAFHFRYPQGEGPFDAEGVFVCGEYAYLFTKAVEGTRCYRLPLPEKAPAKDEPVEATLVATTSKLAVVTGAAISRDGRHLALLTYLSVTVVDLPEPFGAFASDPQKLKTLFELPKRVAVGLLGQTEGVCFDGLDLLLTTESGVDFHIQGEGKVYRIRDAISPPAADPAVKQPAIP